MIALYLRTLRNLRPIQWLYMPVRRIQRWARRRAPGLAARRRQLPEPPAPPPPAIERVALAVATHVRPAFPVDLEALRREELTVLGRTVPIAAVDWEAFLEPPLWAYHLHYFDLAVPLALAARNGDSKAYAALEAWVHAWIARCRPGRGPGWDAFPISERLVNWAWVDALLAREGSDNRLLAGLRASAAQQADYLLQHLEYELLANHLLKNAKALYVASVAWGTAANARRWHRRGSRLIEAELREQILADGGHFERAPMYHGMVLQDLLEVALLAGAVGRPSPVPSDVLARMAAFHEDLTYLDGARARFNDTTEGLVNPADRVGALYRVFDPSWAHRAAERIEYAASGYFGFRDVRRGEMFVIDGGPPGPRYQPGHAHCDLLSFEYYHGGRPWIVDPGVHGYAGDEFRAYARSTRAHNTLTVAGREQSEIWGAFRMGRQARVLAAGTIRGDGDGWAFAGAYAPYWNRRISHERSVERRPDGVIVVADQVRGAEAHEVEGALHFHPSVDVTIEGNTLVCRRGADRLLIRGESVAAWTLARGVRDPIEGWFFPAFGVAHPATTARYRIVGGVGRLFLSAG